GNTVLLGLAVGQGHLQAALRSVLALIGFSVGVAVAATLVHRDRQGEWSPAMTVAFGLETALLVIFALVWHLVGLSPSDPIVHALIVLAALAMGIQSGAVHRLRVPGVMTTYITGTLTTLMSVLTSRLRQAASAPGAAQWEHLGLMAGVFVVYAVGALVGAVSWVHAPAVMGWLPVIAVAIVTVNATLRHAF
ncbi:MAG TPA: YoaK family protein, partial [Candidatus Sulfotelmatobacter sp.]|nr:YoaK family protein [Candidatus Sulfotelmatobacter sp.]